MDLCWQSVYNCPKLLATQSCHGHSNPLPEPPPHLSPLPVPHPLPGASYGCPSSNMAVISKVLLLLPTLHLTSCLPRKTAIARAPSTTPTAPTPLHLSPRVLKCLPPGSLPSAGTVCRRGTDCLSRGCHGQNSNFETMKEAQSKRPSCIMTINHHRAKVGSLLGRKL